jgi:hypothetical protein
VKVGDTVNVKGLQLGLQSGDLTVQATSVDIPLVGYKGTIGNLSTNGFTLTSTSSTVDVAVSTTSSTQYRVARAGHGSSALGGISNGEHAEVTGRQNGADNVIATLVQVTGLRHGRGRGPIWWSDGRSARPRGRPGPGFGPWGRGFGRGGFGGPHGGPGRR